MAAGDAGRGDVIGPASKAGLTNSSKANLVLNQVEEVEKTDAGGAVNGLTRRPILGSPSVEPSATKKSFPQNGDSP
jgi:hypothetical protein